MLHGAHLMAPFEKVWGELFIKTKYIDQECFHQVGACVFKAQFTKIYNSCISKR